MTLVDPLITETADRLFGGLCTHEAIQRAEATGSAPEIWSAFAETGFPWISIDESVGGSGGSLLDALEVLRLVGYHAAPIPAAETGILGGWLLASGRLTIPEGIVTVAPGNRGDTATLADDGTLSGTLNMVPWGRVAERLVLLIDGQVVSVDVARATVEPRTSLAGEPRDTLTFDRATVESAAAPDGVDATALRLRGALSRVALTGGAIEKMSQLTVSYTNERKQFGQAIARFQAVQQHLVWAAQDAALGSVGGRARRAGGLSWAGRIRDRLGQTQRQPGRHPSDQGLPSGPRRDGHDPGIPAAPLQPTAVVVAQRIRGHTRVGAGGRPGSGRRRRRRPLPADHRRHRRRLTATAGQGDVLVEPLVDVEPFPEHVGPAPQAVTGRIVDEQTWRRAESRRIRRAATQPIVVIDVAVAVAQAPCTCGCPK